MWLWVPRRVRFEKSTLKKRHRNNLADCAQEATKQKAEDKISEILEFPGLVQPHGLANYDAAYLALATKLNLPLATTDSALRDAVAAAGQEIRSLIL